MSSQNDNDAEKEIERRKALKGLIKGIEGFMAVLDKLDGVSREDDFRRIDPDDYSN